MFAELLALISFYCGTIMRHGQLLYAPIFSTFMSSYNPRLCAVSLQNSYLSLFIY